MPTLHELPGLAGQRLGPTPWREMTQERVKLADLLGLLLSAIR